MLNQAEVAEREWILRRDGDLYFPETFVPRRLEKDYNVTNISDATRIALNGRKALASLLRATDEQKITRPTPYYAMIQMDGDKMGIILSDVENQEEHVAISRALSTFSRQSAPDLVEDHYPGCLIYAGGDDVFALAPLARDTHISNQPTTVLELVDQLQRMYHDIVQKPVFDEKRKASVTASISVAIAHHFSALSYVRRKAKEAEDLAKDRYGRNALVVTVMRRSGEQTRVGCHWQYDGLVDDGQPVKLFSRFYHFFKEDTLSPKCVYNLLEEAPTLIGLEREAQKSEIKRVLQRQLSENKKKELNGEMKQQAEFLVALAEAMDDDVRKRHTTNEKLELSVELHSDKTRYGIIETLGWLLVMAFLARKESE
jgi:CRISPR-associated protein Cmr2